VGAIAEEEVVVANPAGVNRRFTRQKRVAFTLLELILSLSLTVIVVLSITMAINVYWKQFNVRRTNVEEAQLARALLRHMADDLRSAMQYTPADLTGLEAVSKNGSAGAAAALGAGAGGDGDGGEGSSGDSDNPPANGQSGSPAQGGTGQGSSQGKSGSGGSEKGGGSAAGDDQGSATGGFTGSGEEDATEQASTTTTTVGLYGSASELRMDVSRLPRVDQYEALLAGGGVDAVAIPSDVKTVTYFLRSEVSADAADTPLSSSLPVEGTLTGRGRGLMRREVDRATSAWADQSGSATTAAPTDQARLLAEEVVGLSFQYFDGIQWLTDWDSDQIGGLPLAVEIILIMDDADPDAAESPLAADTTTDGSVPTERTYRLVVHIPTATIPTTDPAAEAAATGETAETTPMGTMP